MDKPMEWKRFQVSSEELTRLKNHPDFPKRKDGAHSFSDFMRGLLLAHMNSPQFRLGEMELALKRETSRASIAERELDARKRGLKKVRRFRIRSN